jgi:hypothetical protein
MFSTLSMCTLQMYLEIDCLVHEGFLLFYLCVGLGFCYVKVYFYFVLLNFMVMYHFFKYVT